MSRMTQGLGHKPLLALVPRARDLGMVLARRFAARPLTFSSMADIPPDGYKTACEWYAALKLAQLTKEEGLLQSLVDKFQVLRPHYAEDIIAGDAHVDRYVFGIVPLQIYLATLDPAYLEMGLAIARNQQASSDQQIRDAVDDMFMITALQLQAYRATSEASFLDFASKTMIRYLDFQEENGLFFHNVSKARVQWGRGNGWFAAGMAQILGDLDPALPQRQKIETSFSRMMQGLLGLQGPGGLWYQVLDMPDEPANWEESSGSAMFAYAMAVGLKYGILDAQQSAPALVAAWEGLERRTRANGDLEGICIGTWYREDAAAYMGLEALVGDGHGQAPLLWTCTQILQ